MEIERLYTAFLNATEISTDTRSLKKGALFFALSGPNFDGNRFAEEALGKGAHQVVVDDPNTLPNHPKALLVENTLSALQQLATHHRKKRNIPIIGLTGSNGKTTTKELIREVLQKNLVFWQQKVTSTIISGSPSPYCNLQSNTKLESLKWAPTISMKLEISAK